MGNKRAIIASLILMTVFAFSMRYTGTYNSIALICFAIGLGSGVYMPCIIPIITSAFDSKNWGKAISFHETAAATSILTIPLLVVFLLKYFEWRTTFVLLSAVFSLVAVIFFILAPNPRLQEKAKYPLTSLLRRKDFWIFLTIFSVAVIVSNGVYSITPLFLVNEKEFELAVANKVFGFTRIGGFVLTILIGFLLDRLGAKRIMLATLIVAGLSTICLALAEGFWMISVMLLIQGTVCVGFFPAGIYAISRITKIDERSLFTSICLGIAILMGLGLAPLFMGVIADIWSFQAGMIIIGAITTLMCLLFKGLQDF